MGGVVVPLSRSDQLDLIEAIHEGQAGTPPWATFLARLRRRLRADRALMIADAEGAVQRSWQAGQPGADARAIHHLPETLPARLRPGRVYALADLDPAPDPAIADGRFARVVEPGGAGLCVALLRESGTFSSGDGALLAALVPHLAIALANLAVLERSRQCAAIADGLLRRAGIAWSGHEGAAVAGPAWRPVDDGLDGVLLLPPPASTSVLAPAPAGIVAWHEEASVGEARAALLAARFGLTASEGRLALALAGGQGLSAAAAAHGLTIETARNYSKRIYAKTGARGQADLVRRILESIVWLA